MGMKQNTDMEKLKNDVAIQDAIVNRNETLQKEVLIAKVSTQQKEGDLQNYKELLDKDRAITFLNKQLTIKQKEVDCLRKLNKKGNSRERSVTVSPNGDEDTIEQNLESEIEDDFIFVEDLKNDDVKDNIPLG